jgi:DNA-binding IscR family transcriptional regulator
MKPTAAARYALRALAHLAALSGNALVGARDLARTYQIPEKYLH